MQMLQVACDSLRNITPHYLLPILHNLISTFLFSPKIVVWAGFQGLSVDKLFTIQVNGFYSVALRVLAIWVAISMAILSGVLVGKR